MTTWNENDRLPAGRIRAIAQDPDGYLWLATDAGLVRFDGVRFDDWSTLGSTATFRAFTKAQARNNLPIFTHTNYSTGSHVSMDMALRQLDALESAGGKPSSIAIGHVCCLYDPMVDVAKRVARRGAFVAFDRMTRQQQWVSDAHRIEMIKGLLDAGLVDKLLISSDYIGRINTAVGEVPGYDGPLHGRDGGPGYARPFILSVPQMMKAGISVDVIRRMTVDNPRRFLTFVPTR